MFLHVFCPFSNWIICFFDVKFWDLFICILVFCQIFSLQIFHYVAYLFILNKGLSQNKWGQIYQTFLPREKGTFLLILLVPSLRILCPPLDPDDLGFFVPKSFIFYISHLSQWSFLSSFLCKVWDFSQWFRILPENVQLQQHCLLKWLSFLHWIVFEPLSKFRWACLCRSISELHIQCHWSMCLSL